MSCRFTRYSQRTDIIRRPCIIPMSDADRREAEELNRRREARRQNAACRS